MGKLKPILPAGYKSWAEVVRFMEAYLNDLHEGDRASVVAFQATPPPEVTPGQTGPPQSPVAQVKVWQVFDILLGYTREAMEREDKMQEYIRAFNIAKDHHLVKAEQSQGATRANHLGHVVALGEVVTKLEEF